MPDYLGVVADMFLGASVCSHARLTGTPALGRVIWGSCTMWTPTPSVSKLLFQTC